ncbi:MAG TPA: type 4a pilus biogenesis protein PilO [Thermodesulfovibrionales bacterium]|nr:type 4a pilus biogenesis protein PilO [Thermodesulfovibrionales bacterium]
MALKLNIKMDTLPLAVKVLIAFLPAIVISALVIILLILPRHKEIQRLNVEITKQENDIAKDQVKAAKLSTLKGENVKLRMRLDELKLQLPEEREVSGLLKQVSDLGIKSGLKIVSWRPEQKKDHPSGTIYEIPVAVELSGSYHNLGIFFSRLTKLNRIVNISDIKMGGPQPQRSEAIVRISFKATTFSAISDKEAAAKTAAAKTKNQ